MEKQKVYILEDERHNRDMLIHLLQANFESEIDITGTSDSIAEATGFLGKNYADILLLDIELSDGQVFELLNKINYKNYKLIFITGYSEHAIKAIKYAAVDYLLKPVDKQEFILAMEKVLKEKAKINPILDDILYRKKLEIADYLIINSSQSVQKIPFDDIIYLKAEGIYTKIIHKDKKTLSSKPIGIYEDVLPANQFFRCHKSLIVNKSCIKSINKGRSIDISMINGDELAVAVRKKDEFLYWLNN